MRGVGLDRDPFEIVLHAGGRGKQQALERGVDTVEDGLLCRGIDALVDASHGAHERGAEQRKGATPRPDRDVAESLRPVLGTTFERDLVVRATSDRIILIHRDRDPGAPHIEFQRHPRFTVPAYGKTHRIDRGVECLARHQPRKLMMAVSVGARAAPDRVDHLRPERANHGDDVAEHRVTGPVLGRFLGVLGKPKVKCACEILTATVNAPRGEEFFGANRAEWFAEFVADKVLAAIAAREREIRRLDLPPAREPRNGLGVFIVRMRANDEHARRGRESAHQLVEFRRAPVLGVRRWQRDRDRESSAREVGTECSHWCSHLCRPWNHGGSRTTAGASRRRPRNKNLGERQRPQAPVVVVSSKK